MEQRPTALHIDSLERRGLPAAHAMESCPVMLAHYGWVRRCAGRLNADAADDLTQETFRLAWKYRQKMRDGQARGFLSRLLRWAWQRHLRTKHRRERLLVASPSLDGIPVERYGFGDRACDDWEKYARAKKALKCLSAVHQETFTMVLEHHYRGFMLDRASGLSKMERTRFDSARKMIRRQLGLVAAVILMAVFIPVLKADPLYLDLATTVDQGHKTWQVSGTLWGDLSRTSGLAGISLDVTSAGGDVTIASSANQMPAAFSQARSDGTAGLGITGSELSGQSDFVSGLGMSSPVLLASGTYTGDNGEISAGGWPSNVTLSVPGSSATISPDALVFGNADVLMGDANGDGVVDFSDFVAFSNNDGMANAGWAGGDFNGDGITDSADFALLSGNFGNSIDQVLSGGSGAGITVLPEPATLGLFGVAFLLLQAGRARTSLSRARRRPTKRCG